MPLIGKRRPEVKRDAFGVPYSLPDGNTKDGRFRPADGRLNGTGPQSAPAYLFDITQISEHIVKEELNKKGKDGLKGQPLIKRLRPHQHPGDPMAPAFWNPWDGKNAE